MEKFRLMGTKTANKLKTKCGRIAFLGRANAGKSTLLNAFIGEKICGVSKKPHTTRNQILGVVTEGNSQYIILDTPGLFKEKKFPSSLSRMMSSEAYSAIDTADICCYLFDLKKGWTFFDQNYLSHFLKTYPEKKWLILGSKSDLLSLKDRKIKEEELTTYLSKLSEYKNKIDFSFVSAKQAKELEKLKLFLSSVLPYGEFSFDQEDLTDRSEKFIFSELIREAAFRQVGAEIPYSLGTVLEKVEETEKLYRIQATIIVGKKNHKPILLGKGGDQIKSIGTEARKNLERFLAKKVFLSLHVKVHEGWTHLEQSISEYQGLAARS